MEQATLSAGELRIIIAVIGAIILALIYLFGRPRKPGQGRRTLTRKGGERREPTLRGDLTDADEEVDAFGRVVPADDGDIDGNAAVDELPARSSPRSRVGVRPDREIERIVTLFVCARPGDLIAGPDLVVAAEKAGLVFGDQGIFHRMPPGKSELGPIFSMVNMVKPGHFDMTQVDTMATPGVSFFMALPGPLAALDAWDAMLPTAQRLAELLDANVLDEQRNTLGRQGIAHIRDELRAWDRKQESNQIRPW